MHMKKILWLVFIVFVMFVSCEEQESPKQVTPESLSKDPVFLSIMEENQAAINRFESYMSSLDLSNEDIVVNLNNQLKNETDYSKLIVTLGYKSIEEFESVNSNLNSNYNLLMKSYPELKMVIN